MRTTASYSVAFSAWLITLLCSCTGATGTDSAKQTPSADIEKLSRMVNLPERPRSTLFVLSPRGKTGGLIGPTDYRLIALLEYDSETLSRLKASAQRVKPEVHSITLGDRPEWFPQTLLSTVKRCASRWCIDGERYTGDAFLKGGFVTATIIIPDDHEWLILRAGT